MPEAAAHPGERGGVPRWQHADDVRHQRAGSGQKAATDGYVLFHAEGATGAAELQKLPLAHIELKENGAGGIPEKVWRAHVKSQEQALKRMKPSKVICAPEIATTSWPIVREDTHLALEDAHRGNVAQDTALWLAVHVLNHDHKVMKSDELRKGGFLIRLTAQHRPSGREVIISSSHLLAGDVAWLQPALDEPGEWVCTVAVVNKDGATVMGSPWHVTLTVAAAVCCVELQTAFEEEEDQTLRLGEPLPPLVLTALDVVGGVFELPQSAAGLQFDVEVTWQPSGQQNLRIDTAGLQTVVEGGTARLEGLVLRGTLATGKSSGSVKLGVKLADLSRPEFDVADLPQSKVARKLDVRCGRPATLELENKGELVTAGPFDADEPLPAVRLLCRDQDGNPCAGTQVTLEMSHGGEDQLEPEPFAGRDGPFETSAKGEILLKRAAFRVNGDALQLGGEVDATLRFVARFDPDQDDEDAVEQVSVQLAQRVATEQPELAKLTMHVQGAGVVSCGENFVIEVHGEDTEGSACRVDLAEFGARTWLQRSAMSGEVDADYNAWTQDGDAVKMTLQLSGKAGELDLELPPDHDYSNICDTLTLKLTAGEPAKVVARLLGGAVMNGRELSVDARLVDEHENFIEGYGEGGITWEALQAEDTTQLCVSALKRGAKCVAAELKSSVLTTQPLRTPTEFGLVVAAQFKRAGVVNRPVLHMHMQCTFMCMCVCMCMCIVYHIRSVGTVHA